MAMSVFCDMFGLMFFGMTAATNTSNKKMRRCEDEKV